jgi:hypothetical protein
MATGGETGRRASAFEVVGVWLHVWTAPRDVDVPPVPWRKLAIGTGIGAVVLAAALAVMIPRIDSGKTLRAAQDRAFKNHAIAVNRARIVHEQRPRHGADAALEPAAGATATEVAAARTQLVHSVESAILADSQARSRAGEMRKVEGPTTCSPTPGTKTGGPIGVFDCFTVSRRIQGTERTSAGIIGYPFRAVVDFRTFSYAWCKTEQFPGEKLIPDPRLVVQLPPACQAPKDAVKTGT